MTNKHAALLQLMIREVFGVGSIRPPASIVRLCASWRSQIAQ
ncbi:hypothetical protein [Fischerella sp. JS2]|nr:hypothetical protein [Fischerella sp. JS2]